MAIPPEQRADFVRSTVLALYSTHFWEVYTGVPPPEKALDVNPNDWDAGPEGYWDDLRQGFGISDETWEHVPGSTLREVIDLLLRTWDGVYRGPLMD